MAGLPDAVVRPRVHAVLPAPLVVLAFALSFSTNVWLQPLTWQVRPLVAGLTMFLLFIAASAALPAGVYALFTGAFRRRPIAWDSDPTGHRFSAQSSPRYKAWMIASGAFVARIIPVERVPNEDQARIARLGASTTVFIIVAAVLLLRLLLLSMTNRPSISLTPDGLTLRRYIRRKATNWDELQPGRPLRPEKRNPAAIDLHLTAPNRPTKRLSLPTGRLHIDTAFLAYTIRWYVDHPDHRSRIGDALELEELRQRFAAAQSDSP
jgi:hypothetical protein